MTTEGDLRRAWLVLTIASASTFLFVLDAGFLSVAFPVIEEDFPDSSRATLVWVSVAYFVTGVPALLIGAALGDRFGRSRVFVAGLVLFGLGALATAAAPVVGALIAARAVEGIGVGLLSSMSLALVLPEFPEARRGAAIGAWGGAGALAAVLAPTGGAALVEGFGWRPAFGLLAPIAFAAAVAGARLLPASAVDQTKRLDVVGMGAGAVTIASAAMVVSLGNEWGWASGGIVVLAVTMVSAAMVFARASRRRPGAVLDRSLVTERNWLAGTIAASIQQLGFLSMFFSTPLILVNIWDWSVLEAGMGMSVSMAVSTIMGPIGGRVADRQGDRSLIAFGALVSAGGALWWRLWIDGDSTPVHFFIGAVMVGFGGALCGNLTTSAALRTVDRGRMAVASAMLSTSRRLFAGIGIAISVVLLGESDGDELLAGAHRVWVFVVIVTLAMIPPTLALRSPTK